MINIAQSGTGTLFSERADNPSISTPQAHNSQPPETAINLALLATYSRRKPTLRS